jgi:hypothetical protein
MPACDTEGRFDQISPSLDDSREGGVVLNNGGDDVIDEVRRN